MLPSDPKKLLPLTATDGSPDRVAPPPSTVPEADHVPGAPPPALSAMPGLGTMLHALRRCGKWAVPLALLAGGLVAAVVWLAVPGQFVSTVVFRIRTRPSQGSLEQEDNFANVQRAQVATLKSFDVLDEAIRESRVEEKYGAHYTAPALAKKLITLFVDGPELMQVAFPEDNPEVAAALLEALARVYPARVQAVEEERVKARIAQLRDRIEVNPRKSGTGRLAELLREKRAELQLAENKAGLDDASTLATKYQSALALRDRTQQNRSDKHLQRLGMEAELIAREKRLQDPPAVYVSDAEAEETLQNRRGYQTLVAKIELAEDQLSWVRKNTTGARQEKDLPKAMRALRDLRAQRREQIAEARRRLTEKAKAVAAEKERQGIARLRNEIEQVRKQETSLDTESRRWAREVENLKTGGTKAPPEILALRDEVRHREKEFDKVSEELAALEGSLPISPRITVQAGAFVPPNRDLNRPIKLAGGLGLLAFLGVLGGLCFLEASGRRVSSGTEVSQGLGLRVVGTLPRLPAAARNKSAAAQSLGGLDARYGLTEAVDTLRTVLLHSPRLDGARVVVVTSAIGGEGKTTLASHLAASLARAWRKTLLIDGDLRKPAAHVQFDLPLEPGLSEALRGEIEFDDTIKPTMTSRLWLMPAGKVDAHSLQALAQDVLENVFERLKEQYDFIVIDTSPVLPIPDGLLLAQQADTVLLSVLRDHSRLPAVYAAQQKLEALGIHVLGSVIIGEKTETYGHAVPYPQA